MEALCISAFSGGPFREMARMRFCSPVPAAARSGAPVRVEPGGQFTNSAQRSRWPCRTCAGLRYASEGGAFFMDSVPGRSSSRWTSSSNSGIRYNCGWNLRSWIKRVRVFDGEARLAHLRGVRRSNARELRANVVDDVKIAVRTVAVPQATIRADCLCVRCIHLN
jgi:hypothetical protein